MNFIRQPLDLARTIVGPFRKLAIFTFGAILVSAATQSLSLAIFAPILQIVLGTEVLDHWYLQPVHWLKAHVPEDYVLSVALGVALSLLLFKAVVHLVRVGLSSWLHLSILRHWRGRIFDSYLNARYVATAGARQGALMDDVVNRPAQAIAFVKSGIEFLTNVLLALFLLAVLMTISWQITLGMGTVGILFVFLIGKFLKKYAHWYGQTKIVYHSDMMSKVAEAIAGVRQIKLFSWNTTYSRGLAETLSKYRKLVATNQVITEIPAAVGEFTLALFLVGAVILLDLFTEANFKPYLPIALVYIVVSQKILGAVSTLLNHRIKCMSSMPAVNSVLKIIKRDENTKEEIDRGFVFERLETDIELKNISFAYPNGHVVFENFNLSIPRGEVTAIIGSSGMGKSTITDLIAGLWEAQQGEVLINDIPLQQYSLRSIRQKIGFVSQDHFMFNLSVLDNIRVGFPEASRQQVVEAAKQAHAHSFIEKLPQGYETVVGDRGLKISGGQRQRLAIARAMIRNPEIIILDEATSSLDDENEKLVNDSIRQISGQKTVIVVAHRSASIGSADRTINLEKLSGIHHSLVAPK